ncbi:TMEM175 family protein [Embleya sp. NBC_00888]|uniref:TMEM175 family protein n=1 Tax=Embleya sp. NBC_00888 TaxID=2975960 RepID=UPI003867D6B2
MSIRMSPPLGRPRREDVRATMSCENGPGCHSVDHGPRPGRTRSVSPNRPRCLPRGPIAGRPTGPGRESPGSRHGLGCGRPPEGYININLTNSIHGRRGYGRGRGSVPSAADRSAGAFSDGVFAIAITLLVLDIAVPPGSADDLAHAVFEQWSSYLGYVVSFATIGAVWLAHSAITEYLEYANIWLMRLNLLLLLAVSFLPFPTKLLSEYIREGPHRIVVCAADRRCRRTAKTATPRPKGRPNPWQTTWTRDCAPSCSHAWTATSRHARHSALRRPTRNGRG